MDNTKYLENWNIQLKRSVLPYIILSIINKQDCYGYLISTIIEDTMGFEVTDGTLYPILARLNKEELIKPKWVMKDSGMPRKFYEITDSGKGCLGSIGTNWEDIINGINKLK